MIMVKAEIDDDEVGMKVVQVNQFYCHFPRYSISFALGGKKQILASVLYIFQSPTVGNA